MFLNLTFCCCCCDDFWMVGCNISWFIVWVIANGYYWCIKGPTRSIICITLCVTIVLLERFDCLLWCVLKKNDGFSFMICVCCQTLIRLTICFIVVTMCVHSSCPFLSSCDNQIDFYNWIGHISNGSCINCVFQIMPFPIAPYDTSKLLHVSFGGSSL